MVIVQNFEVSIMALFDIDYHKVDHCITYHVTCPCPYLSSEFSKILFISFFFFEEGVPSSGMQLSTKLSVNQYEELG